MSTYGLTLHEAALRVAVRRGGRPARDPWASMLVGGDGAPAPTVVLSGSELEAYARWLNGHMFAVGKATNDYYAGAAQTGRTADGREVTPGERDAVNRFGDLWLTWNDAFPAYADASNRALAVGIIGGPPAQLVYLDHQWDELRSWHGHLLEERNRLTANGTPRLIEIPPVPANGPGLRQLMREGARAGLGVLDFTSSIAWGVGLALLAVFLMTKKR